MQQPAYPPMGDHSVHPGPGSDSTPLVGILMCTYNGAAYLREQVESFIAQTHTHWHLFASDDGSTDDTVEILRGYQSVLDTRLTLFQGPRSGFAQNFMSLIRNQNIKCDAYVFSDQDDIWLPDKLSRSLAALGSPESTKPMLYCSRTRLIDTHGQAAGHTPLFLRQPSFKNALVQSLAGANTMMINEAARELLARTHPQASIVAHDWLTYMLVSGCGGRVIYDSAPSLLYRQHPGNLIGANTGMRSRLQRLRKMLSGRFKDWNEKNLSILAQYSSALTPENQQLLEQFQQLRGRSLLARIAMLQKAGFYRQTWAGTFSLYVAVILRQI